MTIKQNPPVNEAEVIADFERGLPLSLICSKHHIGYNRAVALRARVQEAPGAEESTPPPPIYDGDPDCFHLDIYVPCDRVDWLIGNLSHDEAIRGLLSLPASDKAQVLENLYQDHVKARVEAPSTEKLSELARHVRACAVAGPAAEGDPFTTLAGGSGPFSLIVNPSNSIAQGANLDV
jgi:hypothetical protein